MVAGCDLSTHAVDVVKVSLDHDRAPEWHRFPLTGSDAFDRARCVRDAMPCRSSVFWDDCLGIGIEHPAGHHGTGPLLRIQGAILSCLPAHLLVHPLPPSSWRKLVGLPGNASKADVADYAIDRDPDMFRGLPQDACDAYCIALATRALITTPKEKAA